MRKKSSSLNRALMPNLTRYIARKLCTDASRNIRIGRLDVGHIIYTQHADKLAWGYDHACCGCYILELGYWYMTWLVGDCYTYAIDNRQ